VKDLELLQWAVLGLSATGVAYTILGLSAAYLALIAAKEANRWAYYMYELALMAIRLQLMQLCAGTVPVRFLPFSPLFFFSFGSPARELLVGRASSPLPVLLFAGFKASSYSVDG